ncbi:MAG: sulfite exporter TauE/SafE family protein [Cellvibrio sp.]|nr:sulfite exporter TauE/SafE family protein [Cellvibrio sp.]
MTFDLASMSAAFLLGLFSSAHCLGMCGGIMGALSMAIPAQAQKKRWLILVAYNLARIVSYGLIALLLGRFAQELSVWGGQVILRWLAGLLLIAMGLYLANWWRGLIYLETAGRYLWVYLQPLSKQLMPVNSVLKAMALGFLWGWLPCGLVYSALMFAMAQGSAIDAAIVMLAFGLGTLPAVLLSGVFAQTLNSWLQVKQLRWLFAVIIIVFGGWTLMGTGMHSHHTHHQNSQESMQEINEHEHDHSHHH